jgi:glc operon protein GlcG
MLRRFFRPALLLVALVLVASNAFTQSTAIPAPPTTPYGTSINLETAQKAAAAAVAEARKNNWTMAVAILDTGGYLVYFEKMDGTQTGSVDVAIEKARSAVLFRRPTKVFQDSVTAGGEGSKFLRLTGAVPIDGGFPIIADGKIIGAIGVSGGAGDQDGRTGKAGADSVK